MSRKSRQRSTIVQQKITCSKTIQVQMENCDWEGFLIGDNAKIVIKSHILDLDQGILLNVSKFNEVGIWKVVNSGISVAPNATNLSCISDWCSGNLPKIIILNI